MAKRIPKKIKAERRCRKKIAKLLWLMDFQDDPTGHMETKLLQRLRQIQERAKNPNSLKKIRKITFKFDGKKYVNQTSLKERTSEVSDMEEIAAANNASDNLYSGNPSCSCSKNMENPCNNSDDIMKVGDFITSMGGSESKLVIQKTLTATDCDKNQCRLLIPGLQVKNPGFLMINEKRKLEMKECISVEVFDPERRKRMLNLAQWNMKNPNYALRSRNWTNLKVANGLREGMVIQVSSFRVQEKLCFVIERV